MSGEEMIDPIDEDGPFPAIVANQNACLLRIETSSAADCAG